MIAVSEVDIAMNRLFAKLVGQGKSFDEIQSILDSVYTLFERIEK